MSTLQSVIDRAIRYRYQILAAVITLTAGTILIYSVWPGNTQIIGKEALQWTDIKTLEGLWLKKIADAKSFWMDKMTQLNDSEKIIVQKEGILEIKKVSLEVFSDVKKAVLENSSILKNTWCEKPRTDYEMGINAFKSLDSTADDVINKIYESARESVHRILDTTQARSLDVRNLASKTKVELIKSLSPLVYFDKFWEDRSSVFMYGHGGTPCK